MECRSAYHDRERKSRAASRRPRHSFSSQRDGAPDDMGVAGKFGLPETVAEDGDAILALESFVIREGSSEQRGNAQHIEEIAGEGDTFQTLRLALAGQEHLAR